MNLIKEESKVGYITLTGDMVHEDHFRLLAACCAQCTYLIVGLVTDDLGKMQKREPLLSFEHRRAILVHSKYVNLVVEHKGEPKALAWHKLKFDILFTTDEYMGSQEFLRFGEDCPHVKVVYFPKNSTVSTTAIIERLHRRLCDATTIVAVGISGNIVRQGFGPVHIVKPINFAREEVVPSTEDVFGFYKHFDTLPRNWKVAPEEKAIQTNIKHTEKSRMISQDVRNNKSTATTTTTTAAITTTVTTTTPPQAFPMISGIHSARELDVNVRFRGRPWCTFMYSSTAYYVSKEVKTRENNVASSSSSLLSSSSGPLIPQSFDSLMQFAERVCLARRFPMMIINIIQRDAGITFQDWCDTVCTSVDDFLFKVARVDAIIDELAEDGVVHGDIHSRNIMVDHRGDISIIDFGWVTARHFSLCKRERAALENMLQTKFDHMHFHQSMRVCPATRRWMTLTNTHTFPPQKVLS